MGKKNINHILSGYSVIPTAFTMEEFKDILTYPNVSCIVMKFGDINSLYTLLKMAHSNNKYLILHMNSIKGIEMCEEGVKFLARIGTDALITNKPSQIEMVKKEGIIAIQNMFLLNTNALKTGIQAMQKYKPDAVNILPATIPKRFIKEIIYQTGIKIIAGGLIGEIEELEEAIDKGINAVITSRRELWENKNIIL